MGHPYYQGPIKHTQVRGRDGLILKLFFFCMFIDRDGVEVHKHAKRGQYPAILTEQAWSIKDSLYGFQSHFSPGKWQIIQSNR